MIRYKVFNVFYNFISNFNNKNINMSIAVELVFPVRTNKKIDFEISFLVSFIL